MTPILELQDLSFRYEGGLPGEKVLDALTFAVAPGERVGLVGCNGVGKSTLLKILVGILPIQAGALTVGGLPMKRKNLAEIRRKVGYIFQDSDSQLFMPTVRADVAFAAENYGIRPRKSPSAPGVRWPPSTWSTAPIGRCTGFPAVKRSSRPSRAS